MIAESIWQLKGEEGHKGNKIFLKDKQIVKDSINLKRWKNRREDVRNLEINSRSLTSAHWRKHKERNVGTTRAFRDKTLKNKSHPKNWESE